MVVGRERIERLRNAGDVNDVERDLIRRVLQHEHVRVVLFRAVDEDGRRVWELDQGLSESELEDAGLVMTRALLPLHRRLMAGGVMLMVHTDWGLRDCHAMRHGVRTMGRSLAQRTTPLEVADHWLLTHMLLHLALPFERVATSWLPGHLALIDRRWTRMREIVARLPPEAIG
jgi:hypothetical protein